jgi:hypothetical protein
MGTKANPGEYDCHAKALPDEPLFTLLARDPSAPDLVERWAEERRSEINAGRRPSTDLPMVREARTLAFNMRRWRKQNEGKWLKD